MYLSSIQITNFRCFKDNIIYFNKGLTILVGENDSGKSAIIDAIRIVLGTTDFNWVRINPNDFYNEDTSLEIKIVCKFSNLSINEQASFLECLSYEEVDNDRLPFLYIHWTCKYLSTFTPPRPISSISTGKEGNNPILAAETREILRVTYLKALRDAYGDMQSGRHSRLSQIMQNIPNLNKGINEYTEGMTLKELSITGINNLSNILLEEHNGINSVNKDLTEILKDLMLLKNESINTSLTVAGTNKNDNQKLISLLEKLDLALDKKTELTYGKVGLGTSNIMSMACELLLHRESEKEKKSTFLLIEEPEAHIHAQRQLKLIQSLEKESENGNQQIILTTHSPLLASVAQLKNIILVKDAKTFPLSTDYTNLEQRDYNFLEKYLDATKANLFFARSVIIVEGPGEALLLPTIAKLLGLSFTDFGVSLVDVRSTGLRRYARIFQRKDNNKILNINVACITDKDIMPNCAPGICINKKYLHDPNILPAKNKRKWRVVADFTEEELTNYIDKIKNKADGQNVKTYISNHWTLEYDLAYIGLNNKKMKKNLLNAIVKATYTNSNWGKKHKKISEKIDNFNTIEEKASYFYSFFSKNKTSKADFAQQLSYELEESYNIGSDEFKDIVPDYLAKAIKYVTEE